MAPVEMPVSVSSRAILNQDEGMEVLTLSSSQTEKKLYYYKGKEIDI